MKRKTVVALMLGGRRVASSRIRGHVPLDLLESEGFRVVRLEGLRRLWPLQLLSLILFRRPEVLFLQKVMPPSWFVAVANRLCARLVFDLDDAIYLGYPGAAQEESRRADSRIRKGLPFFDSILTSNDLIRKDLGLTVDSRCVVFPGPSPELPSTAESCRKDKIVVWLGSPSTISNVESILPHLTEVLSEREFLIVGSPTDSDGVGSVSRRRWSPEAEKEALQRSWCGLMPLEQTEWNKRKAGYKLLEYLRYDVIPVAEESPILRTLLGAEAENLCEIVEGSGPEAWALAVDRSLHRHPDKSWERARDTVFARWSSRRFARLIVEPNWPEGIS